MDDAAMSRHRLVAITLAFEGLLLVLAVGLGWLFGVPALAPLRFDAAAVAWGLAASLVLLAGLTWAMRWRWTAAVRLRELLDGVMLRMFAACKVLDLAVISALAGIGEEAFFRGFLQQLLSAWIDPWAAVIVAGGVFGLAHWVSSTYAVTAALIGCLFGWQLIYFDNLLVPMVSHGAYDFLALSYLLFVRKAHLRPEPEGPEVT